MSMPNRRDEAAALLMEEVLPEDLDGARVLVVGEPTGRVAAAVSARGGRPTPWRRAGPGARPWPPDGPFDLATVRLRRERGAFLLALHAAASRLAPGGTLWVHGANDEGIRSAGKRMAEVLAGVEAVRAARHCRVLVGRRDERPVRGALADWRQVGEIALPSGRRPWVSYPGTFARGGLDPATLALLAHIPRLADGARVLDFACGTGPIAAEVLARYPRARVEMVDHDALAVEAARENAPRARAIVGDALPEGPFAHILANPPYHDGVARSYAVVEALVRDAPGHLTRRGDLRIVVQRQVPVRRWRPDATVLHEDGRFRVWRIAR